jgi:hypothetical protein
MFRAQPVINAPGWVRLPRMAAMLAMGLPKIKSSG